MSCVIGVDLGTSAVKTVLVNQEGKVCYEVSKSYPLYQTPSGHSEQNPEDWVESTVSALCELVRNSGVRPEEIEGLSFSGQMHGLVLLDGKHRLLRNAILWNDTRTTPQCRLIEDVLGKDQLLSIAKNPALEGFTLPKLLWVKENEPEIYDKARVFLLPKDYLRFRMTGGIHSEPSDAAGTLLLNVTEKTWSDEICRAFDIDPSLCPPLVKSTDCVGTLLPEIAERTGLSRKTRVFAGGADNACGAIGAGIMSVGKTLCSIGTSGVILSYSGKRDKAFPGNIHYFNHVQDGAFYAMGVTLAAGYSLSWLKKIFAPEESYDQLLSGLDEVPLGASGLLFTPYLVGERTPHADASIRGSFIGVDGSHKKADFVRAVVEGITFSLKESLEIFRSGKQKVDTVVSIGGGAKNEQWLQIQADIFDSRVIKLKNEQGPSLGAAMMAAFGCGWFDSLGQCSDTWVRQGKEFIPNKERAERYHELFRIYRSVYERTQPLTKALAPFRG